MRQPIITLLAIAVAVHSAFAQESAPNPLSGQAQPLTVAIVRQTVPGFEPIQYVFISCGTNEFFATVPAGYRIQNEPAQGRILFLKADNSCWLTARIIKPAYGSSKLTSGNCRDSLLSLHPGAAIAGESGASAGGQSGTAYDLQWISAGGLPERSRVVFISSAVGILEFTLTSSASQFPDAQNDFAHFLAGFCPNPKGSRKLPPAPSNS